MHFPTISIITPTLGRETLLRTMNSFLPQLGPDDEWLIAADADSPAVRDMIEIAGDPRIVCFKCIDARSGYGNAQRNAAMQRARGDVLMFVDDDDFLLPLALAAVRREAVRGVPMMFRMDYRPRNVILWRTQILREANVGGGMFVVPNRPDRLATWPVYDDRRSPSYRASDFHFITSTMKLWPAGSLRWCLDVIYCCPQHGRGR